MAFTQPFSNVTRERSVSVVAADFEDVSGFFVRANTGGNLRYLPMGNETEIITKAIDASSYFIDPVQVRKIYTTGTTASGLFIGYGV